ncbi:MAG: 1-(5-phosphoribosyl)-5-[(5-phosphoribosylamino)methylideneamino]imidazole-4-carboxamide isomerase [Actinomycetota bacterium]|nr:1-(5-phosphoribosyl)-5-[(5-phosphoribosylamino)methylideneamino]imidazole-4-carboxamide isomerase [Actinomycetota bacterium]
MLLFPAIDVRGGRCVRLHQGDYGRETVYDTDPASVARRLAGAGARWLHVVDLDGARTGVPENADVVAAIVAAAGPEVSVEVGGGIRDRKAVEAVLATGAARVVLGTAAVRQPELVDELAADFPVVVGLDARDGELAVEGWTVGSGRPLEELVSRYVHAGVAALVVTDIGRDGTMTGPDLSGLAAVVAKSGGVDVVASGGVSSLADLEALAGLEVDGRRLAGAIVGKALYEGRFSVEEAIAACAASA